jgi:hypothetical protein
MKCLRKRALPGKAFPAPMAASTSLWNLNGGAFGELAECGATLVAECGVTLVVVCGATLADVECGGIAVVECGATDSVRSK